MKLHISDCKNICRCWCHEKGVMYCFEMECQCCKLRDIKYIDNGYVDVENYATMVAERAVQVYRSRQPEYYGNKFIHKKWKYRKQP